MADKIWSDGKWMYRAEWDSWVYRKPGAYDPSHIDNRPEHYIHVPASAITQIIPALEEAGWLKPRLDERLRTEDLKITHRLIDLLEKRG